jgi:phosphoglucomutase
MTYTELYRVIKKLNIVESAWGHLYFDHVDMPKTEIGICGKDIAGNYGVKPNGGSWVHEEYSAEKALQRAIINLKEQENKKELEKIKGDFV